MELNFIFEYLQRLHEENEKLFDRLTEKTSVAGSPKVGKFHYIPGWLHTIESFNIYIDNHTYVLYFWFLKGGTFFSAVKSIIS